MKIPDSIQAILDKYPPTPPINDGFKSNFARIQNAGRKVPVAVMQRADAYVRSQNPNATTDEVMMQICRVVEGWDYPSPMEADFNAMNLYDASGIKAPGE